MANLLKITQELISVVMDLRDRFGIYYAEGDLYDFDQIWASTALGFGGMGGQAITIARTYVFVLDEKVYNTAYVYFAGMFAYKVPINKRFEEDLRNHRMASVAESVRYKWEDNNDE